MTRLHLVAFCGMALAPLSSRAAEEVCPGLTTNAELTSCLFEAYKKADAQLNTVYQKALKSAAEYAQKHVANLRDAQRKWVAYRDAACEAEYSLFEGGSGGPAEKASCLLRVTRQRTEDLKNAYHLDEKAR